MGSTSHPWPCFWAILVSTAPVCLRWSKPTGSLTGMRSILLATCGPSLVGSKADVLCLDPCADRPQGRIDHVVNSGWAHGLSSPRGWTPDRTASGTRGPPRATRPGLLCVYFCRLNADFPPDRLQCKCVLAGQMLCGSHLSDSNR